CGVVPPQDERSNAGDATGKRLTAEGSTRPPITPFICWGGIFNCGQKFEPGRPIQRVPSEVRGKHTPSDLQDVPILVAPELFRKALDGQCNKVWSSSDPINCQSGV